MAVYVDLDYQRLLDFANGYTINGQTVPAPPSIIYDAGPALTYLTGQGWEVVAIVGQSGRISYYLSSGSGSSASNPTLPVKYNEVPTTSGEKTFNPLLTGYGNIP